MKCRHLTLGAHRRRRHQRNTGSNAGSIQRKPRRVVIRGIHRQVNRGAGIGEAVLVQPFWQHPHPHPGIQLCHRLCRRRRLAAPKVHLAVGNLPLQVARLHRIAIHQMQLADTRRRQVQRRRTAKTTEPDQQDAGTTQCLLTGNIEFRQQQLTTVALEFAIRQHATGPR